MTTSGTLTLQTELEVFERLRLSLLDRAAGKYAIVKGSDLVDTFGSEPRPFERAIAGLEMSPSS